MPEIVPKQREWGEREEKPRSVRWPIELAKRIDAAAAETGQDWQVALFYLVEFALTEHELIRSRGESLTNGRAVR